MECPNCKNELGTRAQYCPCGWTKRSPFAGQPAPSIDCAHAPACNLPAMCKIQTATGWANLCNVHYDEHYAAQALANCAAKGLVTTEQFRDAWRAGTTTLRRRLRNHEALFQREPGEDWDEPPSEQTTA